MLRLQLPPAWQARNDYGCYADTTDASTMEVLLSHDICVRLANRAEAASHSFDAVTESTRARSGCDDCPSYRNVVSDSINLERLRGTIERGLVTGTIHHFRDHPAFRIRLSVDSARVITIYGYLGDSRALADILGIAATLVPTN